MNTQNETQKSTPKSKPQTNQKPTCTIFPSRAVGGKLCDICAKATDETCPRLIAKKAELAKQTPKIETPPTNPETPKTGDATQTPKTGDAKTGETPKTPKTKKVAKSRQSDIPESERLDLTDDNFVAIATKLGGKNVKTAQILPYLKIVTSTGTRYGKIRAVARRLSKMTPAKCTFVKNAESDEYEITLISPAPATNAQTPTTPAPETPKTA